MNKTDNPHAIRLHDCLLKYTDEQTAKRIAYKIPLSKMADINKKFAWAESICEDLQNEFDENTIIKIRMDCACGPEMSKLNSLKKIYESSNDLDDFVAKLNNLNQGFTIKHENNFLLLIYPQCYCSCVERVDAPISKTWCYCTLGYTKKMFEHILGRIVEVELLESVKTGGSKCVIKIV